MHIKSKGKRGDDMADKIALDIEFVRGDSYERGFIIRDKGTGSTVETTWDDVYFTVKKKYLDRDFKFQKRLSDGGIVYDGDGHFTLSILPEDTNDLSFGDYDCDIELKKGTYTRTFYGHLHLTPEVTHQNNE